VPAKRQSPAPAARAKPTRHAHAPLRAAERKLVSRYDHVTIIPNRMQFLADFSRLRGKTGRHRMLVLVTLADARHYNEILRALGHAFSEDFVRAGLARLREILPADQAIYHVSVLSFAFVIAHEDTGTLPAVAEQIANAFAGDLDVDDIPIRTKVGVGLMPLSAATIDPAEVLLA